jgi:NAD(P)-dependent dehydrogenase (short-subunit alcohol dehydrogenase family)
MRLENRRILVTGGGSGIGLETARLFQREGARIAILDRDAEALERSAALLPDAARFQADVADAGGVSHAVRAAADALGGLDGLVNVAGIGTRGMFDDTTPEMFMNDVRVNLLGPFLVSKAAVPHLRAAGGGTIANVSSSLGLRPMRGRVAYSSSKGGLIVMTKAMAIDLAPDRIRVNVVCPGYVDTPLVSNAANGRVPDAAQVAKILDASLQRRVGAAIEIANTLLFLSCDDSSFVTASVLAADGGAAMH